MAMGVATRTEVEALKKDLLARVQIVVVEPIGSEGDEALEHRVGPWHEFQHDEVGRQPVEEIADRGEWKVGRDTKVMNQR